VNNIGVQDHTKVDPFDLVVFGGTGDLAYRKLFPALYHRDKKRAIQRPDPIIGRSRVARCRAKTSQASVREALTKHNEAKELDDTLKRFL